MLVQQEGITVVRKFSLAYLLNVIGGALISNIFIVFMTGVKGYSQEEISLIVGVIPLIAMPALIAWGRILDKNKELMRYASWCCLFNSITYLGMFLVDSFWAFFAIAFLRTILTQPIGSICEEYMITVTSKANIPYGKVRRFGTLGGGAVGILSPLILYFFKLEGVYIVGALLLLVTTILFKRLPEIRQEEVALAEATKTSQKVSMSKILKDLGSNKNFLMILAISGLTYGVLNAYIIYGNQTLLLAFNCPTGVIAALPALLVIFEVLILGASHKLKVEEKPYRALLVGVSIMCLRWMLLIVAKNYYMVIISTLLNGIIVGITLPAQNYIIAQVVPERCRSTAYLLSVVMQASIVPGILNLIVGNFLNQVGVQLFGYSYLLVSIIALALITPMFLQEKNRTIK